MKRILRHRYARLCGSCRNCGCDASCRRPAEKPRFAPIALLSKMLLLPLLLSGHLCQAEAASEAAVKVAFLYNFFKFIEWPESATAPNRYTLCLSSHTDFGDHLLMLEGKTVNGKPLDIVRNIAAKDLKSCHLIFIDTADNPGDYARELKGSPVVSVSDKSGFINQGGTIGLIQDGNRLSFEINLETANAGNTRISAQLLKLAKNILAGK
ncbi:YfiR family protein [Methylomonas sp. MO1]|uniref:YfiR family protein n=1 Tax=unclassified Methylomonas TaxID=2608980 RepID=UPI001E322E9C|nr:MULTISPECIES: YfiR family protein [unclassified Methylomonas]MDT4291402.1 YfiR family protein [Methylomonas sp. MO1]